MIDETDIVYRLRKRAEIRRQIPGRKSVQEGKPDRMADLLDEAADEIMRFRRLDFEERCRQWLANGGAEELAKALARAKQTSDEFARSTAVRPETLHERY
ncbi:hypothetical protein CcrC1_gp408 [Caulobacter phage C1]|nr:hypothetical protein CcrC1_gp408 [Caulobacter phage C1]UTU08637.1 hypothetical protein CcrC2_gp409 [Caulobacter phage C2]UTU09151.1 hypothetical protein CcrJ4_gp403 [Caulobacter phage J4]UTU10269.1 hypothetical protein CcrRB23_gp407 [Caulobacter phage RB23]WGN97303.1 hypothetical protein [Bertelyvirus sp.]